MLSRFTRFLQAALPACALLVLTGGNAHAVGQSPQTSAQKVPVLVELFTSEGCSDCPPADKLLQQLDATQPIAGAQAIVLSEHVTYWDHQGWRDPFSLEEMTARQQEYVDHFGLNSSYTPQAVVDGVTQFVGSDARAMSKAVAEAAETPKQRITIDGAHWENGAVIFAVHGSADSGARLVAAIAADATHSEVARGENAGRTLHHVAVVRAMKQFGVNAADGRTLRLSDNVPGRGADATPMRLVVFFVEHKTGHVLAVAEQTLTR